jgi:hypothetical protein
MNASQELEVALEVERRLASLLVGSPVLSGLPIAPLRGVSDLVRLELALSRFAEIHRSRHSKVVVARVRRILGIARARLRMEVEVENSESRDTRIVFPDTQPRMSVNPPDLVTPLSQDQTDPHDS